MEKILKSTLEKRYPLKAGYKEQSTSKEAAAKVDSRAAILRTEAIEVFKRKGSYGATCEEVAEIMNEDITSIRPRITELKLLKYIIDSGDRRLNRFQNNVKVWRYNDNER